MGTLLRITGCISPVSTRGKGAFGPLLSAPTGASKRGTPTSNLTESTVLIWECPQVPSPTYSYNLLIIISLNIFKSFILSCYKINFQRYESEYISHYKQFESKRPNTVKGEVTRSLSFNDLHSNGSTPRAGLLSTQLGSTLEPPLQRKRIVPYEKNHNIFTTLTVKEQHDRDWLKSGGNSHRSHSPNRQYKEVVKCLQYC